MKMKKIIIVALAVFISSITIAQMPTPPQSNGNITNSSLDKFIGTWMWNNGADTLKIVLKKENILLPFLENSRVDMLIGFHIYKQGNSVIESSISNYNSSYSDNQYTILGGNRVGIDNLDINCAIKDNAKNKIGDLKLTINTSQNQLLWTLKNKQGVKIGNYDYTFSYPLSLTLLKQ
jgi:hypothetical protein